MTYTCLEHPDLHRRPRRLEDVCDVCGRPFRYPLDHPPVSIDGFEVVKALGRGFYGVSFLVAHPLLRHKQVFKVVPAEIYRLVKRDFLEESRRHVSAADGTQHLVPLLDVRGTPTPIDVVFDEVIVACHVAVLKYVEGQSLRSVLQDPRQFGARGAAQIAIDLLRLLDELADRRIRHNDLHAENVIVQKLSDDERRAGEIDESIRAVAIDLGSIASGDAADPAVPRHSDVNHIGGYLRALSAGLLADAEDASDTDYRLAQALEEVAMQMSRPAHAMRVVDFAESADLIREAVLFTDAPWRDPGSLKRFNAGYNAQLLGASFIPRLLIDPGDEWVRRISSPGPQVITGMRGCGKTMLLKALEVHARINRAQQEAAGDRAQTIDALRLDDFVGLYESSDRLLDGLSSTADRPLNRPEARLFLAFARDAVQALRHLQSVHGDLVEPLYAQRLARAVNAHLTGTDNVGRITSAVNLEQALHRMMLHIAQGGSNIDLPADPGLAFPDLAAAISQSSALWSKGRVLFLLDDASTRNLAPGSIDYLCSRLLFKHERCAFKIVTEQQALEQLRSPGLLEAIQIGRDIDLFDLGGEVNERMRQRGRDGGRSFIAQIIEARAHLYEHHPKGPSGQPVPPEEVLGTATLESLARKIAEAGDPPSDESHSPTKVTRKRLERVYHGLNALSAVCVGDIGDVLAIYDLMLRKAGPYASLPLDEKLQTQAFREYCVRRLWNLNRRQGDMRPYAVSFAQAAHRLLLQSYRRKGARLRQYASIHIQIDPERSKEQFDAILDLIDAGIFVFEGGNYGPRLKRFSGNPKTEFILNYRKLFGLSHYIGLAERDRFELRGDAVSNWLDNPSDITQLTGRLGGRDERDLRFDEDPFLLDAGLMVDTGEQLALAMPAGFGPEGADVAQTLDDEFVAWRMPRTERLALAPAGTISAVIGWGFEERAVESVRWLLANTALGEVVLVRYPIPGRPEIHHELERAGVNVRIVDVGSLKPGDILPRLAPVVIDISGLTKALIFNFVRETLRRDDRVLVAYSRAADHFPRNEELEKVLEKHRGEVNLFALLDDSREIKSGDGDDYEFERLLGGGPDDGRRRLLAAGMSVKHMRLMPLLEWREYDRLELLVPNTGSARSKVARHAAEAARRSAEAAVVEQIDFDDPAKIIEWIGRRYRRWYRHGGFDIELALSGSKMHAVAAAAVSDSVRIAQCWYVRPVDVDSAAFSEGYTGTSLYQIRAPAARLGRGELLAEALS